MSVASHISRSAGPREDVFFAVMGLTGSGKSTFVRNCSKIDVKVGHDLFSCTTEAEDFSFEYGNNLQIHLIDTPGFDDTNKSDTEVLKDIATWLTQSYKRKEWLSGILFLHPISATKFTGGASRNLLMFKKLCGPDCFPSVVLATTRWDEVDIIIGEAREKQLKATPGMWLEMIENGSHYMRHDRGDESAVEILKYMIDMRRTFSTALQTEMVDGGVSLQNTQAGQQLSTDLRAAERRHQEELVDIREQFEKAEAAKDYEAQKRLEKMREETQLELAAEQRAISDLKASLEKIKREKQEETRRNQVEAAKQLAEMSRIKLAAKNDHRAKQELEGQLQQLQEKLESIGRKNAARNGKKNDLSFENWLKMGLGVLGNLFSNLHDEIEDSS